MAISNDIAQPRATAPAVTLTMLLIVYTFNFLDRQILSFVAQPMKASLGLTDTQLGMLGGLAFALLYATTAIPLALLADRTGRARVVAISLAVWSLFTALCGVAQSFTQMFLCRLGVGIGEAGGVAPSYALVSEAYPAKGRTRAMAIYSLGIPFGQAAGALLGGYVAQHIAWRTAFLIVGLPGLVLAPVFKWLVRDAPRPARQARETSVLGVFGIVVRKPSFWLLAFGGGAGSMCGYGLAFWLPSLMIRSFGLTPGETGLFFGVLLLICGGAGTFAGGWVGDRLGARDKRWFALAPALCYFASAPLYVGAALSHSWELCFALLIVPQVLAYVWLAPVLTSVQHLVPPHMRATALASWLLINNLIGLGLGSWSMGALSDWLTPLYGSDALRYAIVVSLFLYLVAGGLMALASSRLAKDWVD
jgi:MFS family permease